MTFAHPAFLWLLCAWRREFRLYVVVIDDADLPDFVAKHVERGLGSYGPIWSGLEPESLTYDEVSVRRG